MSPATEYAPDIPESPPPERSRRRRVLRRAAQFCPRLVGRLLARRYLSPASFVDPERLSASGAQLVPLGPEMAVVRHAGPAGDGPRVLLIPGHDGHVRQFARLAGALRKAGASVDLLVLPGHLRPARTLCSLADIVPAIRRCVAEMGPYDALAGHCVGARGLLFALDEGLACRRMALISTPVELSKLVQLGGRQFGLDGAALARFEAHVDRLCAPYGLRAPWQGAAQARQGETLVVHARHDYAAPVGDARALARAVPGAGLAVFERGDHNSILTQSDAIAALTEFLVAR